MLNLGEVVLIIFVIARVLIAVGLFYLIIVEARRYRKGRPKRAKKDKEIKKDANGKDTDGSHGSRD